MQGVTKMDRYREALRMLREAADMLDEAQSELRSIGVDLSDPTPMYRPSPQRLSDRAESMAKDLEAWRCDDCGALLSAHDAGLKCDPATKAAYQQEGE